MLEDKTRPTLVQKGQFEITHHYYPRVLNAHLHPIARYFIAMGNERIAKRYEHLHPEVQSGSVLRALQTKPKYFQWGGCDLIKTADEKGRTRMVIIESNSCPSGQKSMPFFDEDDEMGGYRRVLSRTFLPFTKKRSLPTGEIGVLYDKNFMETSGYAACLAELLDQDVFLIPFYDGLGSDFLKLDDEGKIHFKHKGDWICLRAAFRYVTQRPWNRIPPLTRSGIFNPILCCLAGGRNKLIAAKAYDHYNAKINELGLTIHTPETIWDVSKREVPFWVNRMGGIAVVKVPYSNAGQGVYTITNDKELAAFMETEQRYDQFIVQSLIGNSTWSSVSRHGRLFHVGTVPDKKNDIYVSDLRMMVAADEKGFYPVSVYARRAAEPLVNTLSDSDNSWNMLGTNLSGKTASGDWTTDPERLLLLDSRDFNRLGVGLDDLIEAYIQSILSITAIDSLCKELINQKNQFRYRLFRSFVPDDVLEQELVKI